MVILSNSGHIGAVSFDRIYMMKQDLRALIICYAQHPVLSVS